MNRVPGLLSLVFGRFVQAVFFPSFYGFKRGPIGDEDPLALLLYVGISQEALDLLCALYSSLVHDGVPSSSERVEMKWPPNKEVPAADLFLEIRARSIERF